MATIHAKSALKDPHAIDRRLPKYGTVPLMEMRGLLDTIVDKLPIANLAMFDPAFSRGWKWISHGELGDSREISDDRSHRTTSWLPYSPACVELKLHKVFVIHRTGKTSLKCDRRRCYSSRLVRHLVLRLIRITDWAYRNWTLIKHGAVSRSRILVRPH